MAFETFMEQSQPRPRSGRLLAIIASGLGHSVLLLGLAALMLPPAVKAALPTLVPVSLRLPSAPARPPEPPARAVAAAAPSAPTRRPRPARPEAAAPPAPAAITQPSLAPPPAAESAAPPAAEPVASATTAAPSSAVPGPPSPAPATAAPAAPRRPRFLPEALGATRKLSGDLPRLPPALARTGESYTVLARVCVGETGQVGSVAIERSAHPAVDAQVASTVATWRYHSLLAAGVPIPFCTFVRFEFRSL